MENKADKNTSPVPENSAGRAGGRSGKKRWLIGAGILVLLLLVGLPLLRMSGKSKPGGSESVEQALPVEVAEAKVMPLGEAVSIAGTVAPFKEVAVIPKTPGRVAAVPVSVGQKVQAGQVLVELDKVDMEIALQQQEAALANAVANQLQAQTNYDNAVANFDRMQKLYAEGAISQSQLEQAKAQLSAATSAKNSIAAQIRQMQAAVASMRQKLADTTVTSPISGVVSKVNVEPGEMASQQAPVVVVIQEQPLLVKANLPENVVGGVQINQSVDVFVSATNKTYQGQVYTLAPQADAVSKAYPVEVKLEQAEDVKPGMAAELRISTRQLANALAVPADAVLEQDGTSVLFVVENNVARQRKVKIGLVGSGYMQVVSGLKEGETVVVKGNRLLVDGARVKIEGHYQQPASGGGGRD
ncbi:efflux RND transporter periplasmic adaptor subunit [Desulfurispora thermophila]|uniref:efflux RND transporter periplasmic adaptor subunit n=1 Tax=Desulfurispora thermophila TaxID=265470 RepID=UPI0003A4B81C|nr:efflux RND transporter periplasmic adaptor subunit [Desulfurispora thermophila]